MAKEFKVFFSWQSDLPANQTKRFIEDCIEQAKTLLPNDIILIADEATRNRLGTPDILNSIFEKIEECDLFIADVSIVGSYTLKNKTVDEDEIEEKYIPNSNVLLELGYAAATIGWERCICLANSKFGDIKQLPFDLNHRRITDFSYATTTRNQKINEIAETIKATTIAYIDMPLPRKGFSYHLVGCFNILDKKIENKILPYNSSLKKYTQKTEQLIEEAKSIIEKISRLVIKPTKLEDEEDDFNSIIENMTFNEITKNPELYKKFSQQLTKSHNVKINKEHIDESIKKYLGVTLHEDFYCLGNLKESTPLFTYNATTLDGTNEEKEKYSLICDLERILLKLELREMFINLFEDVVIVPLAIKNTSTIYDERLSIKLKVVKGNIISPSAQFFNPNYQGLEGYIYDEHLVKELLSLPESGDIQFDYSIPQNITRYRPKIQTPVLNSFGQLVDPASTADDYEEELRDYVQDIDEGTKNEFSFSIGAIRPNETLWLDKVLLIKPIDKQIVIKYSIKSNKTTGLLAGTLYYNQEDVD